ncbi:group II intron reverse transcriptase/maturase [Bacillus fengqiuensis]|nr:group II intron reverse transcriptase/maturase [Bacillus fengqiuensis]
MTKTFTDLHERASNKEIFTRLYDLIISEENILLAYRIIKSNSGSKTAGTDGKTIDELKTVNSEELVTKIRQMLNNYQPKKVRRVYIPKPNGDKRPLGIPCIKDRLIQQMFKQILEPIAEAYFYNHSYGFRPLRSTHHAIARAQHLINHSKFHYVVDIDIKGFFDNVNHTLLMKQLWNMGIHDRKVLKLIMKMLKAEIDSEGKPQKGTPQGGIISPLLSNIVLNDLDQWVAKQWEYFKSGKEYFNQATKIRALKTTNLKEGYIVRYADDFKIFCKDWKSAQKWFHAVRLYLKDRLKLDISPEKSQIINLRKRKSEFLGYTIWAKRKKKKFVAMTGIKKKKTEQIKNRLRNEIKKVQKQPSVETAYNYNSYVLGIHQYFAKATDVSKEFSRLAYDLYYTQIVRLKNVAIRGKPRKPSKTYKRFYNTNYITYKVSGAYLYPLADIKTSNNMCFTQKVTPFTDEGRNIIYKELNTEVIGEILKLMKSNIPEASIEFLDNRISRYSMKNGKCEITGKFLKAYEVHCHHFLPKSLQGTDNFDNLRIIHKEVHKLIHASKNETIDLLINQLKLTEKQIERVNQYRRMSNMELID